MNPEIAGKVNMYICLSLPLLLHSEIVDIELMVKICAVTVQKKYKVPRVRVDAREQSGMEHATSGVSRAACVQNGGRDW